MDNRNTEFLPCAILRLHLAHQNSYETFSWDVQGGEGLHTTLRTLTKKFHGIVNGIDDTLWNPATDCHLEYHYNSDNTENKKVIKENLKRCLGLSMEGSDAEKPLVSFVYA